MHLKYQRLSRLLALYTLLSCMHHGIRLRHCGTPATVTPRGHHTPHHFKQVTRYSFSFFGGEAPPAQWHELIWAAATFRTVTIWGLEMSG